MTHKSAIHWIGLSNSTIQDTVQARSMIHRYQRGKERLSAGGRINIMPSKSACFLLDGSISTCMSQTFIVQPEPGLLHSQSSNRSFWISALDDGKCACLHTSGKEPRRSCGIFGQELAACIAACAQENLLVQRSVFQLGT